MRTKKDVFQKLYEDVKEFYNNSPFKSYLKIYMDNYFENIMKDFYDISKSSISFISVEETEILRARYGVYNNFTWQSINNVSEYFSKKPSYIIAQISKSERILLKNIVKELKKYEEELYCSICLKDFFDISKIPSIFSGNMTIRELLDTELNYIFKNCDVEERTILFNYMYSMNFKFKDEKYIPLLEKIYERVKLDYNKIDIKDLDLSIRNYNCLKRQGINTLQDILDYPNLLRMKTLGKAGYEELTNLLNIIGIGCDEVNSIQNDEKTLSKQLKEQYFRKQNEILRLEEQIELLTKKLKIKELEQMELLKRMDKNKKSNTK